MESVPMKDIDDEYKLESKAVSSGFYGSVYIAEHIETKTKWAVRAIPNFLVNRIKNFAAEVDKMKNIAFFKLIFRQARM